MSAQKFLRAVWFDDADEVTALLKSGVSVDTKDLTTEKTALQCAAMHGHTRIVNALLAAGATVNAREKFGGTALHWAAAQGSTDIVTALLEAGADTCAQDRYGDTPLVLARKYVRTECVAVLARAARFNVIGADEDSGLSYEDYLFSRVLPFVQTRFSLANCRLVCTAWRLMADRTLSARPIEFFKARPVWYTCEDCVY
jgi:ankyrin repeat protein